MMNAFDHRAGTVYFSDSAAVREAQARPTTDRQHGDPGFRPVPANYIRAEDLDAALPNTWKHDWFLSWGDVTGATNERSIQSAILPRVGTDFSLRIGFTYVDRPALATSILCAILNSFACDYLFRQKLTGLHVSDYLLRQVPVPPLSVFDEAHWGVVCGSTLGAWVAERVLRLTFTSDDLIPYAHDLSCELGFTAPPRAFQWDPEHRRALRCELDAVMFHLYGFNRTEAGLVMDSFPLMARREIADFGTFRTKETIMRVFDELSDAIGGGYPYVSAMPIEGSQRDGGYRNSTNGEAGGGVL